MTVAHIGHVELSVTDLEASTAFFEEIVGLTVSRREPDRALASLVAEGLSNGEIARRLYISPRTAESHVGHVLDKLALQNRTQLAAWMVDHRRGAPGEGGAQR